MNNAGHSIYLRCVVTGAADPFGTLTHNNTVHLEATSLADKCQIGKLCVAIEALRESVLHFEDVLK